jgi:hypothetical protein
MEEWGTSAFSGEGCGERLAFMAATGRIAEDWAWSGMLRQERELRTDKISVERESRLGVTAGGWRWGVAGVMLTNFKGTVLSLVRTCTHPG